MLRKIVENNDLPEYDLTFTIAGDSSPAVHFIRRSAAERAQIRAELAPHLCRCGTHMRILRAVHRAARLMDTAELSPNQGSER